MTNLDGSSSEQHPSSSYQEQLLVWGLIVLIALSVTLCCFFLERVTWEDDLGLFNPVYMKLHYGKMTYPAHQYPDRMVVHPLTHYQEIASLMRLGIPLYYAEVIPVFLLSLLILYTIGRGPFPTHVKLGLLFGYLITFSLYHSIRPRGGLTIYDDVVTGIRPELHLACAWFAGLITLESGRWTGWDWRKLFWGSFLLSYASGLHFPAAPAFLGAAVYAGWALWQCGVRSGLRKVLAIITGGCLFGVPFLAWNILPHFAYIWPLVVACQGSKGVAEAITLHFAQYDFLGHTLLNQVGDMPVSGLTLGIPMHWHIPTVVVGLVGLGACRWTRGIAVAGLPLVLGIVCIYHKSFGYFAPELLLYTSAVGIAGFSVLGALLHRLPEGRVRVGATTLVALLVGVALLWNTSPLRLVSLSLKPRYDEMELARAAGRQIVGPNALVVGKNMLWYTSGTSIWCDGLAGRVGVVDGIPDFDAHRYLAQFDAVAEFQFMSDIVANRKHLGLSSWYMDGTLALKGFYFGRCNTDLSYLLFSTRKPKTVVGYGLTDDRFYRFEEIPDGKHVFAALECALDDAPDEHMPGVLSYNLIRMPHAEGAPARALVTVMMTRDRFEAARSTAFGRCCLRDSIIGRIELLDADEFCRRATKEDAPIRFYRTVEEALGARYQHSLEGVVCVYEKSEASFWNSLEINTYGPLPPGKVLSVTNEGKAARYVPTSSRDHLASPFTDLPPKCEGKWRYVMISVSPPADHGQAHYFISLQTDGFHTVGTMPALGRDDKPLTTAGPYKVPDEARQIRITIVSDDNLPTLLPAAVKIDCGYVNCQCVDAGAPIADR